MDHDVQSCAIMYSHGPSTCPHITIERGASRGNQIRNKHSKSRPSVCHLSARRGARTDPVDYVAKQNRPIRPASRQWCSASSSPRTRTVQAGWTGLSAEQIDAASREMACP